MRESLILAISTLRAQRMRTVLTAGALALAVALMTAVSSGIRSAHNGMEVAMERSVGAADARLVHPGNGRFPPAVTDTIRSWPEVEIAEGRARAMIATRADGRGEDTPVTGVNAFGLEFSPPSRVRQFALEAGRVPAARGEGLIDPLLAKALDVGSGGTLDIVLSDRTYTVNVVGIYTRRSLGVFQTPRLYLDRRELAEALAVPERLDAVYIRLHEGIDTEAFCAKYADRIPDTLALEPAAMAKLGFERRLRATSLGLLSANVTVFLCASFIILVALASGLVERTRELALLRAVGASRMQLAWSQLATGLAYGVLGAALGIPLGLLLAWGLVRRFAAVLPEGFAISQLGIILAVVGAAGAGLIGAVYPAVVASRITPVEGMARPARPARRRSIVFCAIAGLGLIGFQLTLLALGNDEESRFWGYAIAGLPAIFIGWFLLGPPILLVVSEGLAALLALVFGVSRDLLLGSLRSTPLRHGFTVGALMVSIALLVGTRSSATSVERDWLAEARFADGFAMRSTGLTPDERAQIDTLPFVTATCSIGYLPARVVGRQVFGVTGLSPTNVICISFDPRRFFEMNAVEWLDGDATTAIPALERGEGVIVADRFLVARGLAVGDSLNLAVGRRARSFTIVGVVSSAGLELATQVFGIRSVYSEFAISCVFLDARIVADAFDHHDAALLQLNLAPDVTDEDAEAAIQRVAPGVRFRSARWIMEQIRQAMTAFQLLMAAIAFGALVLAATAVGHVIAASVEARRYELGVLRATGAPAGTVGRLIIAEAVLVAIAAGIVGIGFGWHLAWMDARQLRELGGIPARATFAAPSIAVGWLILLAVTLLAVAPVTWRILRATPARLLAARRSG